MKTLSIYSRQLSTLFFLTTGVTFLLGFQSTLKLSGAFQFEHVNWMHLVAFYAVLFLSSFVSGLSGFGFSAIGALLLIFMQPSTGVALLMLLSIFTQMLSVRKLWVELRPNIVLNKAPDSLVPYLIGGVLAAPVGVYFLNVADPKNLMAILGSILLAFAAYSLGKPKSMSLTITAGWKKSFLVGASGGLVGGFSAFPGSALVVWTGLQSMSKEKTRALTQPYIIVMQVVSLIAFVAQNRQAFDLTLLALFASAVPVVYFGNNYGVGNFKTIDQNLFKKVTFLLLGVSGAVLLAKATLM